MHDFRPCIESHRRLLETDRNFGILGVAISTSLIWMVVSIPGFYDWTSLVGVLIVAAVILRQLPKVSTDISSLDKVWFIVFVLFVVVLRVVIGRQDEDGFKYAERAVDWLYVVPLFFVASLIPLSLRMLSTVASVAALIIFILTATQRFGYGLVRSVTVHEPVQSGVACSLIAVICLALHGVCRGRIRARAFVAGVLAMAATIFTGTRGAMLILPVACVVCIIVYWKISSRKENLLRTGFIVAFWVAFLLFPDLGLKKRWQPSHLGTTTKVENVQRSTGIGIRLAWYRIGFDKLQSFSLFGMGPSKWLEYQSSLVEEGKLDPAALRHSHLHNQLLDVGVQAGWVSLILVSGIMLLPLLRFGIAVTRKKYGRDYRLIALCGLLITMAINSASLADCGLWMANPGLFFIMMTILLSGQLNRFESGTLQRIPEH